MNLEIGRLTGYTNLARRGLVVLFWSSDWRGESEMTGDELDRAIEFLLKQQSQFSVDIGTLKETQAETSREVKALTSTVNSLASTVSELSNVVADGFIRLETQAELDRHEIREAINNLIIANESTRDLSQNVARLAMQTSQRVTNLESKL